jgi:hypothetical protein
MAYFLPFSLSTHFFHPCMCIHNPWRADNEICLHDVYNFVTRKYTFIEIKKIHCSAMVICQQYWSKILAATNLKITVKWPQLRRMHARAHTHTHIWTHLSWLQPLFTLVHTKVMLTNMGVHVHTDILHGGIWTLIHSLNATGDHNTTT